MGWLTEHSLESGPTDRWHSHENEPYYLPEELEFGAALDIGYKRENPGKHYLNI